MTGQTFEQWLLTVDRALDNLSGLTSADLADLVDWPALFTTGIAASQAASFWSSRTPLV